MRKLKIEGIEPGSIFEEMDVVAGDAILSINGQPVDDIMDYRYLIADEVLLVEIEKPDGEIWELEIEKDFSEDLGLAFTESMIETRTCKNNCVFCFIDQMPPGMRETLYVKDDDERLSFLLGNYITLTNLTEEEVNRIVRYRIMPINISVHTTDPELRCRMLNNRFAGDIMGYLNYFAEKGIGMNGQIVLCPGYNDGAALEKTLEDLTALYPAMASVSVVPVGISKFREGLADMAAVSRETAEETLAIVAAVQKRMHSAQGTHFAYASDEFFLLAEKTIPDSDYYDSFPQIENGVGMLRDFADGLDAEIGMLKPKADKAHPSVGVITGLLAADFMTACSQKLEAAVPGLRVQVYPVRNDFFGEKITVSGLVTGVDIKNQVPPKGADYYLIPENMVKSGTKLLLDDLTTEMLEEALGAEVRIVPEDGAAFVRACAE